MDEFLSQFFAEPDYSPDVPVGERPEIQDAIARVLLARGILSKYNLDVSAPYFSGMLGVDRVRIKVEVRSELPLLLAPVEVWVDDFELRFTFTKIAP
mgnify:CR=1 FL=1